MTITNGKRMFDKKYVLAEEDAKHYHSSHYYCWQQIHHIASKNTTA
jgi:hypothetical protein